MARLILILIFTLLISSCKSLYQHMDANREQALRWCAVEAPVVVKQGSTKVVTDTVVEKGDTVRVKVPCPDGSSVSVDCPPNKTITRTRIEQRVDTIENTARYESERERGNKLDGENARVNGENENLKATISKQTKWLIGLGVGLFLAL